MEAKPGGASAAPAPAPMAAAPASEATVSFQQPLPAPPERGSSSAVVVPPLVALGPVVTKVPKKRGRPRKYGPDGSLIRPLDATPISASAPGQYTPASAVGAAMKRGRGRSLDFGTAAAKRQHQQQQQQQQFGFHFDSVGGMVACSAGANFTPHIITVAPGEDVTAKVISFSQQQGPRAICVLSANGVISNVTLRQPDSSGGTLTYEGRFELLSLSGSLMPTENSGARSRSGGMSVSLASPDGRVVGGGVAGLLVAAGPVQIVVGSFLPSYYQTEQKSKKPRADGGSAGPQTPPPAAPAPVSGADAHGGEQAHPSSAAQRGASVTVSGGATTTYGGAGSQSWASASSSAQRPVAEASGSGDQMKVAASGS